MYFAGGKHEHITQISQPRANDNYNNVLSTYTVSKMNCFTDTILYEVGVLLFSSYS